MAARVVTESLKALKLLGSTACRQQFSAWCPPAAAAVPAVYRPFHSCTHASALAKILTDELAFEREEMDKQGATDSALQNTPEGWKLDHKPTKTLMTLSKMMGDEEVIIRLNTLAQTDDPFDDNPNPDGNADEQPAYPVPFSVDSIKGNTALRFECEYIENDENDPSITDVQLVSNVDQENVLKELEPSTYGGPRYQELDVKLQQEFAEYLKARGVDAGMGQYLCRLVYDKEQEDYVAWLEQLKRFTAQ